MKTRSRHPEYIPLMLLALVFCVAFFTVPGFDQPWIFSSILKNSSYYGVIALGMLPVLISGDIDLSVGAQMAFYNVLCAAFLKNGRSILAAVSITMLIAIVVGCLQGAVIAGCHLNSVLTTIATSMLLIGTSSILSKGVTLYNLPKKMMILGARKLLGISMPTLVWFFVAFLMALVLYQTYWGKFFYAVGHNALASEKAGVPILRTKMVGFALESLFCAISSIIYISQLGFAPISTGQDVTYSSLTIAALGGVSFDGGRGKVLLVLAAGLMIGSLAALFTVAGVPSYYQNCIKGAILFAAILTNFLKT